MVEASLGSRLVEKLNLSISTKKVKKLIFHFMCKHLTFPFLEKTEKTFFLLKSQTQKKNSLKKKVNLLHRYCFPGKDERTSWQDHYDQYYTSGRPIRDCWNETWQRNRQNAKSSALLN